MKAGSVQALATTRAPLCGPILRLVGLDDEVERGRIDIALLGQDGFERAHAQLHLGELGAVLVIVVMVVFMVGHCDSVANRRAALNVLRGSPARPVTMRSSVSLIPFAERIDRLTGAVGRAAAWCLLATVLLQFLVVVARYVMGLGSLWLTESIIYAHAALFMLAAAWTLAENGHVRVDVFYADAAPRRKALVDLLGALLLLIPFAVALAVLSLPYVGALVGDPRALARGERAAVRVPAQDPDPAVRRADGAAGRRAGDPCRRRAAATRSVASALRWAVPEILAVLMVVALCALLMAGYPVALTLGGVSLAFALLADAAGVMNFALLGALPQRVFGVMTNDMLLAIPLFVFMGVMLERSRHRRGAARDHGTAVRRAARRARASRRRSSARCWRPPRAWSAPPP